MSNFSKTMNILMEFSLPLIFGVIAALVAANWDYHAYHVIVDYPVFGEGAEILGHPITAHFLINDILGVLFGIAARDHRGMSPGGDLNPPSKAINPLLGTLGGVFGPVGTYFSMLHLLYDGHQTLMRWPTAGVCPRPPTLPSHGWSPAWSSAPSIPQ